MSPKQTQPESNANQATLEAELAAVKAELDQAKAAIKDGKKPSSKRIWEPIPMEDLNWLHQHARAAKSPCLCGCGELTASRFAPGHDARLKERLKATLVAMGGSEDAWVVQSIIENLGWTELVTITEA